MLSKKTKQVNIAIYPKITRKIISNAILSPDINDLNKLIKKMKEGYGDIIYLDLKHDITLQYHGRFKSFIIGIGINPNNENQPKLKLLRIDTRKDKNHTNKKNVFSQKLSKTATHIHWNNTIITYFIDKITTKTTKTKKYYETILTQILAENDLFDKTMLKEAVPYDLFEKILEVYQRDKNIDNYFEIIIEPNAKNTLRDLLNQILAKELLIFKNK